MALAAFTSSIRRVTAAYVSSMEIGTTSTSPQSATRRRSKGWIFSTGCHDRISDDCSRTARGPKRAPGRYEVPPSYGMPRSATSSPSGAGAAGRSMNVAIWPNRGDAKGSRGRHALIGPGRLRRSDPATRLSESRPETLHRRGQRVNLLGRVVNRKAGPRRPHDSEGAHEWLGAVVASAHGDALRVQKGRDVMRVQARDAERHDRAAILGHARTVDTHPVDAGQGSEGMPRQLSLVLHDPLHAELLEILDCRREADGLRDRGGAGLEPPGKVVPLGPVDPDLLDHLAAAPGGLEALQNLPPAVEDSDARGPQHLVRRRRIEIAIHRDHVE